MTDVFISYSRRDKAFVQRLTEKLKNIDRDFWVDWEDIPPSVDWMNEIRTGIENADAFTYVISPDSVRSDICTEELEHALKNNKRLFPLLYREITEPEDQKRLHPAISSHNWIFFRETDDFDKGFETFVTALDTDYKHARNHTRLLLRAMEWDNKNQDNSLLLLGNELAEAERWLETAQHEAKSPVPTGLQETYITVSRRAATFRRRIRAVIGGFLGLVSALALAIFLLFLQSEGLRREAVAARATSDYNARQASSLALASNAQQALYRDGNTDLALALALAAYNVDRVPPPQAQSVLAQAVFAPGTRLRLEGYGTAFNLLNDALAVTPDGTRALAYTDDGLLVLLSLNSGAHLAEWAMPTISSLKMLPDGVHILLAFHDTEAMMLFNIETGEPVLQWTDGTAFTVAISPDGTTALTSDSDYLLTLWDLTLTGDENAEPSSHDERILHRFEALHTSTIWGIAFNGQRAVSGDNSGMLVLWDVTNRVALGQTMLESRAAIRDVDIDSTGTRMLVASDDRLARLFRWNETTQNIEYVSQFTGHTNLVWKVLFLPDQQRAASVSYDSTLIIWDIASASELLTLRGHTNTIYQLALVPGSNSVLTASWDGTLRRWDLYNGAEVRRYSGHGGSIYTINFNPEYSQMATSSADGSIILWDIDTGQRVGLLRDERYTNRIRGMDFSADGTRIIAGGNDQVLTLWDVASAAPIRYFEGHTGTVRSVAFSPDGRTILSSADDGRVILWDIEQALPIYVMQGHQIGRINTVQFHPSLPLAVSGASDNLLIQWDLTTGEERCRMEGHSGVVNSAAFSPDGRFIASGADDDLVILWDVETCRVIKTFSGHRGDVYGVAYSPDGERLLSGSQDYTVLLWDVASGAEVARLAGHADQVLTVRFGSTAEYVYSAGVDRVIIRWQVLTGDKLLEWMYANRYVMPLNCDQRNQYGIQPACANNTLPPVTPFITSTPLPVPSLTPTLNLTQVTATPAPSLTPARTLLPIPSLTPEPTDIPPTPEPTLESTPEITPESAPAGTAENSAEAAPEATQEATELPTPAG